MERYYWRVSLRFNFLIGFYFRNEDGSERERERERERGREGGERVRVSE